MKDFESNRTQIMNSIENRVRQAYNNGYETGFEDGKVEGYDKTDIWQDGFYKGLEEAWECAKRLIYPPIDGGMTYDVMEKVFDFHVIDTYEVFKTNSAYEAIEKIRAYEDEQKGRVTRESIIKSGIEEIAESFSLDEISKVLEQMKGAADEQSNIES